MGVKIAELRELCLDFSNWLIAQSNPCFEVWFYYHFREELPDLGNLMISENWKLFLNETFKGGFDSRKHPIYVKNVIENSKRNFEVQNMEIRIGSTEFFKLAESFYTLVKKEIERGLNTI